jgi:hypothetical protein
MQRPWEKMLRIFSIERISQHPRGRRDDPEVSSSHEEPCDAETDPISKGGRSVGVHSVRVGEMD